MNDPRAAALAASAEGGDQAKDVHGQIHRDLVNDHEQLGPHGVSEHEAALRLLEADYPHLKTARRRYEKIGEREHERGQRRDERRPGDRPRAAGQRTRPERGSARSTARRRSSARAFGYGFLTGRAHPQVEQTGLPGVSRSATGLILGALGGIIGLSVVYDVLVSSESGGRAPLLFIQGVAGLLNRVVAPVDPLGTGGPGDFAPGTPSSSFGGGDFSAAELKRKHQAARAPGRPTNVTNLTTLGRTR